MANWLITLAVTLPCTAVGVLLAARRPANPIGWLLLTLLLLTADPTAVYAILHYRLHHGTLPLGWVAVLFLGGPLVNVLMAILLWLFPDGHLPAGRWHGVSTAAVAAGLLAGIATTVGPGVAVAAATLAAAALFNPLRRRVQYAVDRRFNRTRYDAEAVVASFTARLRQTVDLDAINSELSSTVHRAFEPAHVSIWSARGTGTQ